MQKIFDKPGVGDAIFKSLKKIKKDKVVPKVSLNSKETEQYVMHKLSACDQYWEAVETAVEIIPQLKKMDASIKEYLKTSFEEKPYMHKYKYKFFLFDVMKYMEN